VELSSFSSTQNTFAKGHVMLLLPYSGVNIRRSGDRCETRSRRLWARWVCAHTVPITGCL